MWEHARDMCCGFAASLKTLDRRSEEGWELVAVVKDEGCEVLFWKRPRAGAVAQELLYQKGKGR